MSDTILEVEGLTKRYGKRLAVNNLSFEVGKGSIHGFLGRNGAGKSTSIRMILGLVWPTSGTIRVAGQTVVTGRHHPPWRVGAIVESPVFYDYLPARTNLELLASLSGGASKSRIDEVVELVGLTDRQHDKVGVYSHGMRQRLGLAQALLPNPELIILDEPLDGLDPSGIRHLREVMLNVAHDQGVTIFLSSHILGEVEVTCDQVLLIDEGKKIFAGSTAEMMADSDKVRLRVGGGRSPAEMLSRIDFVDGAEPAGEGWLLHLDHARVPELNRELVGAGLDVLELAPLQRRLEDIFLDMTEGLEGSES